MNKPIAWMKEKDKVLYNEKPDDVFSYIPLYTHPVKELTDEEIMDVWCSTNDYDSQSE